MFNKDVIRKFVRFCAVGVGNTAIDVLCFFVLTVSGFSYGGAQVLAYSAGMINSYILNRTWTFQVRYNRGLQEMARFLTVNLLSLAVSSLILFLCYDTAHQVLWVSKIAATGGGIVLNFVGSHLWVFYHKETQPIH